MSENQNQERLLLWKKRLRGSEAAYSGQLSRMDDREAQYLGRRELKPLVERDREPSGQPLRAPHVRNITAELIEAQVSSDIPQPKVTARRKEDEGLAKLIEDMLRNELDRMPMETINDIQERTVPIQGGGFYHLEWNNACRTHTTTGEVAISVRHPKQVIPQAGVYTMIEDMDYVLLKIPTTKEAVRNRYGVDLGDAGEEEPDIRSAGGEAAAEEMATQYIAYYRNGRGGIGKFSWIQEEILEDLEDYQARRLRRCAKCGEAEPMDGDTVVDRRELVLPGTMEALWGAGPETAEESHTWHSGDACPYCGGREWRDGEEDFEEIWDPVTTSHGKTIPGSREVIGKDGALSYEPTRIPYYKPNAYPLVLQRNVSVFGQLLGDSDADKIADQQNTINRLEKKIIDRLVTAGTRVCMPATARHRVDTRDQQVWYFENASDAAMIRDVNFTGNLQYELAYMAQVYEEARQSIGITDSFQGRSDATAKSGVAKQFAAAQSAGRLESKRTLKNAAYADLFRLIFQFKLAYADEPRPVVSQDSRGRAVYDQFERYDFLEQDQDGQWYWNDQFLFSTDTAAPLANNRERMWEETIRLFSSGCFGAPTEPDTLAALWTKLELLHYPGAADTRKYLEGKLERQQQAEAAGPPGGWSAPAAAGAGEEAAVEEAARRDAMAAVFGGGQI